MSTDAFKEQIREQLKANQPDTRDSSPQRPSLLARATRTEVGNSLREFSVLIAADYPLHRALRLLSTNTANKHLASTIEQIAIQVETGAALWQSMARHPWYFDGVTLNVVRAAEATGKLSDGLGYLADLWEQDGEIRDKLWQALSYPMLLIIMFVGVISLLLIFVVPTFGSYMNQMAGRSKAKIEGGAALVYAASDFLRSVYGLPVVLFLVAAPIFLIYQFRRRNPLAFDRMLGHVPILGRLMLLAELTRFVNIMHLLLKSGVNLMQGLDLAKGSMGNAYLSQAVDEMHKSVEQGKSMVAPLSHYREFPNRVRDMLAVGEESGRLEQMLGHLSVSMRSELIRIIDRLMVLLQPLLLIIMGVIVLATFLTFFLPYFSVLMDLSTNSR